MEAEGSSETLNLPHHMASHLSRRRENLRNNTGWINSDSVKRSLDTQVWVSSQERVEGTSPERASNNGAERDGCPERASNKGRTGLGPWTSQ